MRVRPCSANGFVDYTWILYEAEAGRLPQYTFEYKRDGDRRALNIDGPDRHFFSKRDSVGGGWVDKIAQVPQFGLFLKVPKRLPGFALDGEAYIPGKAHASLTKILGAGAEVASERQGFGGHIDPVSRIRDWMRVVHYEVFNQIVHRGELVRHRPYRERRLLAAATVETLIATNPYLKHVLTLSQEFHCSAPKEARALFKQALELGHEGLMIKDPDAADGEGLWKWKVYRDTCVIITGTTHGRGKYAGQIGAVQGSVRHMGRLIEVTATSGMDDQFRTEISKARGKWHGLVAQVRGQGIDVHGRIRHPRFKWMRPDVDRDTCTWDQYKADMTTTDVVP